MSEDITTTTSSSYSAMTHNDLHEAIRKESTKARTKTNEAFDCMVRMGHMLIELKTRTNHGSFMVHAEHSTGLPQRSINRYMAIARDPDGFRNRRRGIPAEEMLTLTKKATASNNRIEHETKVDTVSILPAVEPPAPRPPSRPADIVVDAEIVVHAPKVETPDEMFQRGLDSLQKSMPPAEYQAMLERALEGPQAPATAPPQIPLETTVETEVDIEPQDPPAPAVAAPTASPAPSVIETSEATLAEILALLPRLRPAEITELHRVIESRWMKPPAPAPVDHLAACWASASPEDRAAFLETSHLIEAP